MGGQGDNDLEVIELTPKQLVAFEAVKSEQYNFVMYGGAIRGGKSFWGLITLLILCEVFPKSRWAVVRENLERIRLTTIPSFNKIDKRGRLKESPFEYTHHNGSIILFKGENIDKDPELDSFKGLEVNGFLFEEINECNRKTLDKAFERAGSWIIPKAKHQPKPIIMATCNPSSNWVKDDIYNPWREGRLNPKWCFIQARIDDNPHLSQDFKDSLQDNMTTLGKQKFVDGDWDVTDNDKPWAYAFKLQKHVSEEAEYNPSLPIYLLFDFNVEPATCGLNQFTKDVRWQFDEIHVSTGSIYDVISEIKYKYGENVIYRVSGDASGWAREKATFNLTNMYEIIQRELHLTDFQIDTPRVNPSNKWGRTLTNFILEKKNFLIHPRCKYTILDLQNCRVLDDGNIDKKNSTMSHHLDHVKYFFTSYFADELNQDYV